LHKEKSGTAGIKSGTAVCTLFIDLFYGTFANIYSVDISPDPHGAKQPNPGRARSQERATNLAVTGGGGTKDAGACTLNIVSAPEK